MINGKLCIGILGGGGILNAHAPGFLRLTDRCMVAAIAEPDTARHDKLREWFGSNIVIKEDFKQVIEMPEIDAVDIILPHNLHKEAAVSAAKAGKHVLCEKVMARNVYECNEMIDACRKANVLMVVCHDRRYAGDWTAMKKIIDSGELGEILFWKLEHNQNVVFPENAWVRRKEELGGGAIMSCLTHQIDALRWYGGEFESVACMTEIEPERMEGECIGAIVGKMASGALALLSINWYTQSHNAPDGLWYEFNHVTGTRGEAYYMSGKGTYVKLHNGASRLFEYGMTGEEGFTRVAADIDITGHEKCIEEFVKAASGEKADILTFGEDTIKTVEVAEACYIAEASGKTVKFPLKAVPWDERKYK